MHARRTACHRRCYGGDVSEQTVRFPGGAELTHLLVVSELARSVTFYRDVVGAELVREYGGTSAVFRLAGTWLLLVTAGGPTADKPTVTFTPPDDPDRVSSEMTFRVVGARCRLSHAAG
jgi:catechol 2,3-dioxygenase-like lactoylglutathione lyase family enzyme